MSFNAPYSNNRALSVEELILINLTASFPEMNCEPKEISKLRSRAEADLRTSYEIPGSIMDSMVFEFLRRIGKIHD